MQVEKLALPKEKAEKEYEAIKEELRYSKTQFNQDMRILYAHMRHGGKVLDLWESIKLAGLNADGDPKLAVIRADAKRVRFTRNLDTTYDEQRKIWLRTVNRGGNYMRLENGRWEHWTSDLTIPGQFLAYPKRPDGTYAHRTVETITPIIPARIMNALRSHALEKYHILWEVEKWQPVPPKDPILLRKVTPNMFLIIATWDLSPLERAVIRGRIQS